MPRLFEPTTSVKNIPGDGNCQFRSLSWALHGTEEHYADFRRCIVAHLKENWDRYKEFTVDPDTYLSEMSKPGTFGDRVTVQAFCDLYDHGVAVIKDNGYISCFAPDGHKDIDARDYVTIVHAGNNHYNACEPYHTHPTDYLLKMCDNLENTVCIDNA